METENISHPTIELNFFERFIQENSIYHLNTGRLYTESASSSGHYQLEEADLVSRLD
jgi:hypothetical protein